MEPNSTVQGHRTAQPLGAATPSRADSAHLAGAGELRDALEDVVGSVELVLRQANGFLARQAEERPHVLLASAVGLGFVLGGGLASRTGALLTRVGGRLALAYFLQRRSETSGLTSHPTAATEPSHK